MGKLLITVTGDADPDLLVGFDTSDDAGVYRVREDLALVQTLDLITPVCDDPYMFGQVAAANSLSDVYAMGGVPLTAMNICCFPSKGVPEGILPRILSGGLDKIREAGATLLGGHTVQDSELKYGLSVTGTIRPDRILRNAGARPGQSLILTKPIGGGVMIAAAIKDRLPWDRFEPVVATMARLNSAASELGLAHAATGCTDVTGFGLAGHALEMARASHVSMRLRLDAIPVYEGALPLIEAGVGTRVTAPNRAMAGDEVRFADDIPESRRTLLFDPQTSGGLLLSVPPDRAGDLVEALRRRGDPESSVIGETAAESHPLLRVE